MKTPTMTLQEIERALQAQNRDLEAAFDDLTLSTRGRPVTVPVDGLRKIQELCEKRTPVRAAPTAPSAIAGIRC